MPSQNLADVPNSLSAESTRNLINTLFRLNSTASKVMKYYSNLRLVYEMEARVRELRRSTEAEPAPAPRETPKQAPRDGTGSPSSTVPSKPPVPKGSPLEREQEAVAPMAASFDRAGRTKVRREVFRALRSTTEDQAERSLV